MFFSTNDDLKELMDKDLKIENTIHILKEMKEK